MADDMDDIEDLLEAPFKDAKQVRTETLLY